VSRRALGVLAVVLWGCGGRALAPDRPPSTSAGAPPAPSGAPSGATSTRTPSRPDTEAADRVVAAALVQVARSRELEARVSVRSVLVPRKDMAVRVREAIGREIPAEVVSAEGDLLIALGVVPVTFDYVNAVVELMTAELAGYYEPMDKTMYLAADLGAPEQRATLAHELVHALQDQHYDLGPLLEYRPDASDVQGAVHALAEGDAMSAMLDQLLEPNGQKATDIPETLLAVQARAAAQFSPGVKNVPDVLKRSLIAPYVDGLAFVHFLRRRGGWAEVDRAWQHLPESTEQLLHPEKFVARERAISVPVPPAPPGGPSTVTLHDVEGEQTLRILFEEWVSRKPAADAAASWGGDRAAVFREGGNVAVAIHVRYDNAKAAALGFEAFRAGVGVQANGRAIATPGTACAERADRGPLLVAHAGRDLALVAGPYRVDGGRAMSSGDCTRAAKWAALVLASR
jgi:hypothetical protein